MALFGTNSGNNFQRPAEMVGRIAASNVISLYQGTTVRGAASALGFFTEIGNRGVNVNTDFSAGVAKTILNVSGRGLVSHIVGPTAPGAGETTTITITRDGVAKPLTFAPASGDRVLLGPVRIRTDFTTANHWTMPNQVLDAGKTYFSGACVNADGGVYLPDWDWIRLFGCPCLDFKVSMLIQITHSQNVTNTAADGRQSGVCYMLEQ